MSDELTQLKQRAEAELEIPAALHDYQWEGVAFLYRSPAALLADEMGLGKTVQTSVALSLVLNERNDIHRTLIVAPSSLIANWMSELAKWAPGLTVRRVQGNIRDREMYYLLPVPVLVASYEQIRVDALDRIRSNTFDLVILDEAQRIKNRNSTTSLACRILPRKRSWALSATPLENEEADMMSILGFLDRNFDIWQSRHELMRELETKMLRRRKADVRADLPPVIMQDLRLELSEAQRQRYDALWASRSEIVGGRERESDVGAVLLGLITRLKTICNFDQDTGESSKLEAVKLVIEGAGTDAKILVFSQFVQTLRWVSGEIDIPHELLTGDMAMPQREAAIARFKNGNTPRLLLISLRAGGVGLNLGEATHVVLFDRWWNPAVEIQAVFRAHRFDRELPLHVVRFLVNSTIEERIAEILDDKENLFEDVVESAPNRKHRFTKRELLNILQIGGR